jgi:hypothetical protein
MEGQASISNSTQSVNSPEVYQDVATRESNVASVLLVSNDIINRMINNKVIPLGNVRNPQQNSNNLSIHDSKYKSGTGDKPAKKKKRKLNEDLKIYKSNFKNLFEELNGHQLMESDIPILDCNYVSNVDKYTNPYPFLKHALNILNESKEVITSLNENFTIGNIDNEVKRFDINDFRKDLGSIIKTLESSDETQKYSTDIIKIKSNLGLSLRVFGFDIIKSIKEDVFEKVLNSGILFAAVYSPSYKSLYFITSNLIQLRENKLNHEIITYSIKDDKISYNKITSDNFTTFDYFTTLKRVTGLNNLVNVFTNLEYLNLQFNDNLYHDSKLSDIKKSVKLQSEFNNFQKNVFGS